MSKLNSKKPPQKIPICVNPRLSASRKRKSDADGQRCTQIGKRQGILCCNGIPVNPKNPFLLSIVPLKETLRQSASNYKGDKMTDDFLINTAGAYDLSLDRFYAGIDPMSLIPDEIKNSPGVRAIMEESGKGSLNSGSPDIKEYLAPNAGMRFLDAGCSGNLAAYRLDKWGAQYYGVDISAKTIEAMKSFAEKYSITVGGLYHTDISNMPFDDNFFDIATVIGVFEYCPMDYIGKALSELSRVLKPGAKAVLDFPNENHPHFNDMCRLEECLGRIVLPKSTEEFERLLGKFFVMDRVDYSRIMVKYFLEK